MSEPAWILYVLQLALNLAILLTILSFRKRHPTASILLIPYWIWVSFATVLNFSLWLLHR